MSDLSLDVNFEGSGIEVDAEFGYSNTRYVSPSEYTGELRVVPSHERHILETTGKMLNGNVTVEAAPTSEVIFTENGEYLPPEGEVGFSRVSVNTGIKAIAGKFEITRDLTWSQALEISIPHELGTVPSMIVIWTHNNDEAKQNDRVIMATWMNKDEFSFPWSEPSLNPFMGRWTLRSGTDKNLTLSTASNPILGLKHLPTATEFHLIEPLNTGTYKVGTYYYLLMAGNWEQYADANSGNVTA